MVAETEAEGTRDAARARVAAAKQAARFWTEKTIVNESGKKVLKE